MKAIAALPALLALALLAAPAPAAAAAATGRQLVLLEDARGARAASLASALAARAGARVSGRGVPKLGIATVRGSPAALAALRREPAVEAVVPEHRRELRRLPNDPALSIPETAPGTPPGTALQWALLRQGFPEAWDVTTAGGSVVGVIDTGLDGGHPELGPKVAAAVSFGTPGGPLSDEDGHGSHVGGLACAATDNGIGIAGAGWHCRLAVVRAPNLTDEDIVNGIVAATDAGAEAINMSFGGGPPSAAIERAIEYAFARDVVLVAAASNDAERDQGAPGSQLQPGDAPDIRAGRGLVVTGADFSDRNPAAGFGRQISLAAYGFFEFGPPGIFSAYPAATTLRDLYCLCRATLAGDNRYAYLMGTSMASPQVAAAAVLVARANPTTTAADRIEVLKRTARRAAGGWTEALGWGILDVGAAVRAALRVDRTAPRSWTRAPRSARRTVPAGGRGGARARVRVRWTGRDPRGRPGLVPSGVRSYDVYVRRPGQRGYTRTRRATTRRSLVFRLRSAGRHAFYVRARDRAGNREPRPRRPEAVTRVR